MNHYWVRIELGLTILVLLAPLCAAGQNRGYLTSTEVDKLRDAQGPSQRIKIYLSFQQDRLGRMEAVREANGDSRDNIEDLLNQYISIDNELKDWIQYQFDHDGDMRKGLRALLDEGPKQLEILRHIQKSPGPEPSDFSMSIRDAIADMSDTLDGATQALAVQQKKFPQMAANAKAEAHALKKERKQQKKLNKKERKMRKRHRRHKNAGDSGQN